MKDKSREEHDLLDELARLQQRVASLEVQLACSQQSEEDHRQITDSLPVLLATAGLDGWYKEVNAAFERILGWSEQESLGCNRRFALSCAVQDEVQTFFVGV